MVCKNCNFVFVNPILKLNVQNKIIKNENSYINVLKNKINIKLDNLRFQYGLQKINRKRKKFETANFKIAHNDLFNKFCTEIEYSEYKAIGSDADAQ